MNAYVESSVLLRIVFQQEGRLAEWTRIERPVTSALTRVECLRTVDRGRVLREFDDEESSVRRAAILARTRAFHIAPLSPTILARAESPFPVVLRTLDAIHLATALRLRRHLPELAFATHDERLANAARAEGFIVYGV